MGGITLPNAPDVRDHTPRTSGLPRQHAVGEFDDVTDNLPTANGPNPSTAIVRKGLCIIAAMASVSNRPIQQDPIQYKVVDNFLFLPDATLRFKTDKGFPAAASDLQENFPADRPETDCTQQQEKTSWNSAGGMMRFESEQSAKPGRQSLVAVEPKKNEPIGRRPLLSRTRINPPSAEQFFRRITPVRISRNSDNFQISSRLRVLNREAKRSGGTADCGLNIAPMTSYLVVDWFSPPLATP
ncbi:hypothetical protein C8R44DRAFT_741529 [Mycena epipterygia]|nr:hypothetical protein C8R44DRAFT_741529 [Mycena epipterygia]